MKTGGVKRGKTGGPMRWGLLPLLLFWPLLAEAQTWRIGEWTVTSAEGITILYRGDTIVCHSKAQWGADGVQPTTVRGRLKGRTLTLKGRGGYSQWFTFDDNFFTTQFSIASRDGVSLNRMAPIASCVSYQAFAQAGNYVVSVPWDNDAWVRYVATPFGEPARESYSVAAMLNADTRRGIILGAITHDVWKTGIRVVTGGSACVDSLLVYGGACGLLTRDVAPHGAVCGAVVQSPCVMVGVFDDWRDGMERYADLCAAAMPRLALPDGHTGCRPVGWNSWGKVQTKINRDKAEGVSDFFADVLLPGSFVAEDGTAYINLDSFWDFGFREEEHRLFVDYCHSRHLRPGIYYCPFTDWSASPDQVEPAAPQYRHADFYLRHAGKPITFDGAPALDPTHPATKARIEWQLGKFKEWGYEYVKLDFVAHGAYEADSHFDPTVTTGLQAYCHGMHFIDSVAAGRFWINLSIAPLFPAGYAHSRRISCDAWGSIADTEYVLSALTYGWWLDHVYRYNDADHVVLEGATEGERRARLTSSAITGVYFLGDDLSRDASPEVKEYVRRFATCPAINQMARRLPSFRPVEIGVGGRAADCFSQRDGDTLYVALFNYGDAPSQRTLPLRRLGLSEEREYSAVELWSGQRVTLSRGCLSVALPPRDAKVYRIVTS